MKQLKIAALLINLFFFTTPLEARDWGAGIMIGDPAALTAKNWIESDRAIAMGIGWGFDEYLMFYGDYLFHFNSVFGKSSRFVSQLSPYVGVGGIAVLSTMDRYGWERRYFRTHRSTVALGARIPVGVEWLLPNPTFGFFIEIVPGLTVIPATWGFIQFGIGARYYF